MKLYNRDLVEIENPERYSRIENIIKRQIKFLVQTYGMDEKELQDRAEKLAIIERSWNDPTYFVEYKNEKKELPNSKGIAAFAAKKRQEYDGDKWNFENGLYMSDDNSEHQVIHELFHFLSSNQQLLFNENGVGYDKVGTTILGYDREDNLKDRSLEASGLNEGITELLATKVDEGSKPNSYFFQTYIADILISSQHNSLLEAYFSESKDKFKEFLEDFDKRQKSVSSDELINMSQNGGILADVQLLKGCLEYSLSFCRDINELRDERKRLLPIFRDMSNNWNIEFNMEHFDLKAFFDNVLNQKRLGFKSEDKTNSQTLLDSAIDATEDTTRKGVIGEQVSVIRGLVKERDEKPNREEDTR